MPATTSAFTSMPGKTRDGLVINVNESNIGPL
jgi:hypothetical protein